jgi:hypothetical protein
LEQRLEVAYRARIEGELVALLADLPAIEARDVATRMSERPIIAGKLRRFAPYVIVNLSFMSLWAATAGAREPVLGLVEGPDLFWPIFSIVGWGGAIGASACRRRRASQVAATEVLPRVLT